MKSIWDLVCGFWFLVFSMSLKPPYDHGQEILSLGEDVEVIASLSLWEEIIITFREMYENNYFVSVSRRL